MTEANEGNWLRRWLAETLFGWEIFQVVINSFDRIFLGSCPAPAVAPAAEEQGSRADDLPEFTDSEFQTRVRWGTLFVLCTFTLTIVGAVTFLFAYFTDASNLLLGGSLAAFCGGMGCTFVLWAHWLMRHKQATEPRETLSSTAQQREAFSETVQQSKNEVSRRGLMKWMGVLGLGFLAAIVISLLRSLGMFPESHIFDTVWHRGQHLVTIDGKPLSLDSLEIGSTAVVFPDDKIGDERAQAVLVRVPPEFLHMPDERNDWAPMGYLAYSRVCTHAGCPVGMYETTSYTLLCPCHQSSFDVLRAARPTGGPATRALPQLPLYVESDGTLRAGGGFTQPPGPGFWSIEK